MTGRAMFHYLPWQLREALWRSLSPVLLYAFVAGVPLWSISKSVNGFDVVNNPQSRLFAEQSFRGVAGLTILLGALLMMSRSVAFDRERQYVRFLFAQPVVPWQFYLQRYVLGLALFTLCYAIVPLGWSRLVIPVPVLGTMLGVLVTASLIGALAMLVAAITQRDGVPIIAIIVGASVLGQLHNADALPTWAEWLYYALPPIGPAAALRDAWLAGTDAPLEHLPLVLGYTVGMLVSALVIVKRAPLVR